MALPPHKVDLYPPTGANDEITAADFNGIVGALDGTDPDVLAAALMLTPGSSTPRSLGARALDAYNVKDFGAVGDGVADDTPAIRAALAAASAAGGGTVFIPAGTYKVMPQEPRVHNYTPSWTTEGSCFEIDADNITIQGAGKNVTKLVFRAYGDLDPELPGSLQVCPDGLGFRGSMFAFKGTDLEADARHDFAILDMELDGSTAYTGNNIFPVNKTTGDGWDYTHHAVMTQNDHWVRNLMVARCRIVNWRGEMIAHAGGTLKGLEVASNEFNGTNANFVSCGSECRIHDNYGTLAAGHGVENSVQSNQMQMIYNNYFDTVKLTGVSLIPGPTMRSQPLVGDEGPVMVYSNIFKNVNGNAVVIQGGNNAFVHTNFCYDCGGGCVSFANGYNNPENVSIDNNVLVITRVISGVGSVGGHSVSAGAYADRPPASGISLRGNKVYRSLLGAAAGVSVNPSGMIPTWDDAGAPIGIGGSALAADNLNLDTLYNKRDLATARNVLIKTTGDTTVASLQPYVRDYAPTVAGNYSSLISAVVTLRVVTAATNVKVWVRYLEPQAAANINDYLAGSATTYESLDVGIHHFGPIVVAGTRYGAATCAVHVQVGTADQVYVTALMKAEDN